MSIETQMITPNIRLAGIAATVAVVLLTLYTAMKLSGEMKWSSFDFIVFGVLLLGIGIAIEVILRLVADTKKRIVLGLAVLGILALIWIELAVGLFGSPLAGN